MKILGALLRELGNGLGNLLKVILPPAAPAVTKLTVISGKASNAPSISLNEYQLGCLRTANRRPIVLDPDQAQLVECGLGFGSEAGEFGDLIKKHFFHGHPLDKAALVEEMGDAFWYAAVSAHVLGIDLSEILEANLRKLRKRYPNGFECSRSINRSS